MDKPLVDNHYVLEKYPGKGGWTYALIPEIPQDKRSHFGWVKVSGTIDGYELKKINLMPSGKGQLFLSVKAEIRKAIRKQAGDSVHIIEIAIILMIFLIQTGIPLPSITGLLARSGVAVFMWSQVNIDQWNALAATFVIFFYNLIIPSLVGLFVLIFNRNNLNENT